MRKNLFMSIVLLGFFSLYGLPAFGKDPAFDAAFYCQGTWEIENPVLHTYVAFKPDGSYRVFQYVWTNADEKEDTDFVVTIPDPDIEERTLETGEYSVTPNGIALTMHTSSEAKDGYSRLGGEYRLIELGNPYWPYYLEGSGAGLCCGLAYLPEEGTEFADDGETPKVSMKGIRCLVLHSFVLKDSVAERREDGYTDQDYSPIGNLMEVKPGWILNVIARTAADGEEENEIWFRVMIQMYPQECFWGWISGKDIALLGRGE